MLINSQPIYKRILLKLSGEALQGKESFGIDINVLNSLSNDIKILISMGIEVAIVIGGGNLFRGSYLSSAGMNPVVADHIGMLATIMNGLAIRDAFYQNKINTNLMSAVTLNGIICDYYNWDKAMCLLRNNCVIILSGGTGNPYFTTDSAACLRGIELEAEIVLKATKVDGVYSCDPMKNSHAILYKKLSYDEILNKGLKVMDQTAFILARDHKMPILIFNINKLNSLCRIVMGEKLGTLITCN